MSKAFTREDVDPPERTGRRRSGAGLPPGALNYMTARGARRLQAELGSLNATGKNAERVAELEAILNSAEVVDSSRDAAGGIAFGATVVVEKAPGTVETFTVVGVDELDLYQDAVSWISPLGKKLLAAKLGDRVTLNDGSTGKIAKVEYLSRKGFNEMDGLEVNHTGEQTFVDLELIETRFFVENAFGFIKDRLRFFR